MRRQKKSIPERMAKAYNLVTLGNDLVYAKKGVLTHFKKLGIER